MKKIVLSLTFLVASLCTSFGQDENDAIRYGFTTYMGTARGMAIGSALGSVGGDFGALSINPAGIGVYRKGEFSFTPSFNIHNNSGTYKGSSTSSSDSKLNFSQVGIVLTKSENEYTGRHRWKAASFAVGVNRQQNFFNRYSYSGKNNQNSIVNKWANDFNALGGLNQTTLGIVNFPAYAAYETYLIDRDSTDSTKAMSYVPLEGDGLQQTKTVSESGHMQEIVISGGGNYMDKLLVGATLGIVTTKFNRNTQYNEDDLSGNLNNDFSYLKFSETLNTEGTGFNLKLGLIYKFNKNFRLGFAVHTPTWIELTDQSRIFMESNTEKLLQGSSITSFNQDTALAFNYSMTTPYRALASGTVLFNRYGFLTADIEYVDYSSMKYNFGASYETLSSALNTSIQNTFRPVTNLRIGGELKIEDIALRAGFAYYGSPYENASWDASQQNITFGIGYRAKSWFMDLAYIYSQRENFENPYILDNGNSPLASVKRTNSHAALTVGWKF